MKRNIFSVWLMIALFAAAVFSLGGCGGSNSSDNPGTARTSIFVGAAGSNLYNALDSKLNFSSKLNDDAVSSDVSSLVEGDIAVFGAGYFTGMNTAKTELLKTLYDNNVTIALLDADNAQINTMRTALGLISDDSIPTKEEWAANLSADGFTSPVEWTGTAALYALAKRGDDDSSYLIGGNTMTYFIPDESAFASNLSGDNVDITSEDAALLDEFEAEMQRNLRELWDEIMTDFGFIEGSPDAKVIREDDGTITTVTYDGSTITLNGNINGEDSTMTLTKAQDGTITFTLSDNLWDEVIDEVIDDDTMAELEEAYRQFQERRVQSFIDWCSGLDELNASMTADKAEIMAAADDEVKLSDLNGESKTWNCSPPAKDKYMELPRPGIKVSALGRSITVNRNQIVTINTYPIHNFTDGSDWYIVKLGGTLNPSGQYHREERSGNCDIVWGHTGYYTFGVSMYSLSNMSSLVTDGITLMDSSPKNVNRTTKKTVGLTMNLSGKLGISDKGPSGEIGGGISRTDSTTYDIHDYENLNDSSGTTAKIQYIFAHPTKGSKSNGWAGDGLEDAVYTSRAAFTPDVRAVWRVDKSHWQTYSSVTRNIKVTLDWADSIARGNYCAWWVTIYPEEQKDFPETITPYTFTPQPPMHFALGKKRIAASRNAQAYDFTILSEGNWTAEMDSSTASWCSLNETSGGATDGENEKQMMVEVSENTTGRIREGRIIFRLNDTKEAHVLTIVQSTTGTLNH